MASTTTDAKKTDTKKTDAAQAPKENMMSKDVAGKPGPSREEILALHRKKAETKEVVTSDVVGYWSSDSDIPITGMLEAGVIAFDSSIDKSKPSLLTKIKATVPTEIADSDGNTDICKVGDLVGVWFKPGMRDLRELGNTEVTMVRDPKKDKDTGKGNAMKGFSIYATGRGQPLRITEDRRDRSKNAKTVFDVEQMAPAPASAPRNAAPLYDGDDKLAF